MTIKYLFKTAIVGLRTKKMRTLLTILGIVIGITAIMLVMSLGKGAEGLILGQLQSFGSKTIAVHPGREPKGPTDMAQMMSDSLREKDLAALQKKSNAPHLTKVEVLNVGGATAAYENETYRLSIFGASELLEKLYDIKLSEGRFVNDDDVKGRSDVVVIGSKAKDELFGPSDALGQKIKIKNRNFKIIGIMAKKGQGSLLNFDEAAVIPYTTAQTYIFGIKYFHHLIAEADSEENVDQSVSDIEATLRASHGITDPGKDDFYVVTQASAMDQVKTITNILTMFLAAVAAISLLVGGVGIMNIMLVSVTERTAEIGLRKAVGATSKDVLNQFLLEAVVLTVVGGIIGIIFGATLSFFTALILSKVANLDWQFVFPVSAMFLGLGVATVIGLVFGLYPARQASRKSPIEALRYE